MSTERALKNVPFCPISALAPWNAEPIPLGSDSDFNPRNTQCIPACPVGPADRTGVVKIFVFLELEPRLNIKYGFNWAGKIEHFSKVSSFLSVQPAPFNFEEVFKFESLADCCSKADLSAYAVWRRFIRLWRSRLSGQRGMNSNSLIKSLHDFILVA